MHKKQRKYWNILTRAFMCLWSPRGDRRVVRRSVQSTTPRERARIMTIMTNNTICHGWETQHWSLSTNPTCWLTAAAAVTDRLQTRTKQV
jgi:hypothetical protein